MVTPEKLRELALAFEEVVEEPHFEKSAFKVRRKIFLTMNEPEQQITVKLTPLNQNVFCSYDENIIYPVAGGWGRQGWTNANLKTTPEEMLQDLLTVAYCTVAPKKLAEKYTPDPGTM